MTSGSTRSGKKIKKRKRKKEGGLGCCCFGRRRLLPAALGGAGAGWLAGWARFGPVRSGCQKKTLYFSFKFCFLFFLFEF
jgi:hypothetical protein